MVKRLFSIKKVIPMIVYTINQMHTYSQIHEPLSCGVFKNPLARKKEGGSWTYCDVVPGLQYDTGK